MNHKDNQSRLIKLASINEEIHFLENLSSHWINPAQEEALEDLRVIRHELEKEIYYEQVEALKND